MTFEYDALGRRLSKGFGTTVTRWMWNGNVPLHQWIQHRTYSWNDGNWEMEQEHSGRLLWLFDERSFVPVAMIKEGRAYSIMTDHLGTPTQAYDPEGNEVWSRMLDMDGNVLEETGNIGMIPFLFQGQYFDRETGLAYNRFRYYSPGMGMYISSDPIGLAGGNPTLYGYVFDPNTQVDPFGLDCDKVNKARARQHKMLQDNKGFNISPTDWDAYPSIGRNGTFITDCKGALGYFGNFKKGDTITISSVKAAKIESDMGLNPGSLQNGFKIREVSGISSMNPRSPLEGNEYFLGGGQHLPGGAPEMVINSIPTTDNASVTTILTVLVK